MRLEHDSLEYRSDALRKLVELFENGEVTAEDKELAVKAVCGLLLCKDGPVSLRTEATTASRKIGARGDQLVVDCLLDCLEDEKCVIQFAASALGHAAEHGDTRVMQALHRCREENIHNKGIRPATDCALRNLQTAQVTNVTKAKKPRSRSASRAKKPRSRSASRARR